MFQLKRKHIVLLLLILGFYFYTTYQTTENFEVSRELADYLPNYIVEVQRRCLPGEKDEGRYCIKEGCPPGMERGDGSGKELCYPPCIEGHESNGMSQCFKKCPPGWKTEGTRCINPRHEFAKDVIPCNNCVPPPEPAAVLSPSYLPHPPAPTENVVVMTPTSFGYPMHTAPANVVYPMPPPAHAHTSTLTKTTIRCTGRPGCRCKQCTAKAKFTGYHLSNIEYFDNVEVAKQSAENGNVIASVADSSQAMNSRPDNIPATPRPAKNGARVIVTDQPCPLGYTLSGDMCYENCPSFYRDEGAKCVRDEYVIDRESYNRGGGIPYLTKRAKFEKIHQGL